MAEVTRGELPAQELRSHEMGMHTEQLGGRSKHAFFDIDLNAGIDGFSLPNAFDVDFNKRAEIDAAEHAGERRQFAYPAIDAGRLRHDRHARIRAPSTRSPSAFSTASISSSRARSAISASG